MLVLILLTSNTMDAQTIYDKNGAMFSFTKDSYKPNISVSYTHLTLPTICSV